MSPQTQGLSIPQWTVGDRLRKARVSAGIEVNEMARRIKRSRNSITIYEKSPLVDELVARAYSQETGVPLAWLLNGDIPPPIGDGTALITRAIIGGYARGNLRVVDCLKVA